MVNIGNVIVPERQRDFNINYCWLAGLRNNKEDSRTPASSNIFWLTFGIVYLIKQKENTVNNNYEDNYMKKDWMVRYFTEYYKERLPSKM